MRRFVLLVVAGLFMAATFVSAQASAEPALARVRASGELRWGGDLQGGEPYVYEDPASPGTLVGFEVDVAAAIAKRMGLHARFVQNDWSQLVPSLERGTFDVILNGFEVTRKLSGRVAFSRPYYVFAERLMARKDDPKVTGLASLSSRRVGTLANSLAHEILLSAASPGPLPVLYEGVEEPYIDLGQGRTDAVLLDDIIAARYGERHADLRVVADVATGTYAVGVLPGDRDLLAAVDAALADAIDSGELERILRKASLWNERQAELRSVPTPAAEPKAAADAPVTRPASMSLAHVVLFVQAAGVTLLVSTLAMLLAVVIGVALAVARAYGPPFAARLASAYVEVYRGTPVLLQLYLLYYGLASFVRFGAFTAAVIGLGMNYGAYEAEVYRAGIQAVPSGQMDAATALGMSTPLAVRRVVLPQAFRFALPNVTNDFIALLKDSSLVSVITVVELTKQMAITAVDVRSFVLPGLLCASLYFAMSYPLSRWARALEHRMARR
jgi:polar amino acid transport system substrate-binding protein